MDTLCLSYDTTSHFNRFYILSVPSDTHFKPKSVKKSAFSWKNANKPQCPPHPKLWAGIKILEKFAVGGELSQLFAWVGVILGGKYKIPKFLWGGPRNLTRKIFFLTNYWTNSRSQNLKSSKHCYLLQCNEIFKEPSQHYIQIFIKNVFTHILLNSIWFNLL